MDYVHADVEGDLAIAVQFPRSFNWQGFTSTKWETCRSGFTLGSDVEHYSWKQVNQ